MLSEYEVIRAGNKMSALRYAIDRYQRDDGTPDVWQAVNDRIAEARIDPVRTCDLCGRHAEGTVSFGVTRCQKYRLTRSPEGRVTGQLDAVARRPGWVPPT